MFSKKDILPLDVFNAQRFDLREKIISLKKDRRIHIGPDITIYIENKQTLLWQIHEMLRVEGGGVDQIHDELTAYSPLCPMKHDNNCKDISFTLMIEIANPMRRHEMLKKLAHIENHIYFVCLGERVQANAVDDNIHRVDNEGKTSAVHFLKVVLPISIQERLRENPLSIHIEHMHYQHSTQFMMNQQVALLEDLNQLD